ncbi:hypothetical protein PVL30_001037 [Lodderomyces elongisporus]|uniref:uncharacterized protein n=1 Tax=Lodderomyces elongisporus TaxID=36914 RepID=UPI0029209DAD|nr:uncharacterized protein PVL30_001037 [Lodderomyces elongisporus]WLF77325.1 hypothetical protein PVL30_001037 [Lodderomyces elongisporus]
MEALRSRTEAHLQNVLSNRSEIRHIDPQNNLGDADLLHQIGYKQELRRHYSTLQMFGVAFSIMGLLPSISSVLVLGLEAGPAGLVWGWFIACVFIFCLGCSLSFLGSAIPTSGGLYYYTNYYCPDSIRVPLSFLIACSNSLGLIGGLCSISYGFAVELLSAVSLSKDGNFDITNAKCYGVFAACVITCVTISCLATKHAAALQTISIAVNVFLILLFIIAVPVGVGHGFNNREFIFGNFENSRDWNAVWSGFLALQPAAWTIGGFDSVIHLSEEAKNAQRAIPFGILGSIFACWILGWVIVVVCAACIQNGDVSRLLASETGSPMAQIIYDALGKKWAVAFMSLIAVGQYLMAISMSIALSRQIWSFARDDGLPIVYKWVKYVNPQVKVPIRATVFAGIMSLILGLLVLINGSAGSGALFSLGICSNSLAFLTPVVLILLPYGRRLFVPGPFHLGKVLTSVVNGLTVFWLLLIMIIAMFPDSKSVNKDSMNYTVVINIGVWALSLIYYYVWGYKSYSGPRSNLDDVDVNYEDKGSNTSEVHGIDILLEEKA